MMIFNRNKVVVEKILMKPLLMLGMKYSQKVRIITKIKLKKMHLVKDRIILKCLILKN